jgi:hypothetical protein
VSKIYLQFTGCTKEQHNWGNHTGDFSQLVIGRVYEASLIDEHAWYTKIYLRNIEGSFNSVCFDQVCAVSEEKEVQNDNI